MSLFSQHTLHKSGPWQSEIVIDLRHKTQRMCQDVVHLMSGRFTIFFCSFTLAQFNYRT